MQFRELKPEGAAGWWQAALDRDVGKGESPGVTQHGESDGAHKREKE
jgi:hypothetical protein